MSDNPEDSDTGFFLAVLFPAGVLIAFLLCVCCCFQQYRECRTRNKELRQLDEDPSSEYYDDPQTEQNQLYFEQVTGNISDASGLQVALEVRSDLS